MPPSHANLLQGSGADIGTWLTANPQIAFYTFTGSTAVGRLLQRSVGLRRISLELGSIAATIVCEDADLERAAPRVANSAFRRAGQACTSTQKLFIHEQVFGRFLHLLVDTTRALKIGNPHDPDTMVGPMISEDDARRAETWIADAVDGGAHVVEGGRREGALLYPTILRDTRPDMRVSCEEIFAPVVSVFPFRSVDAAIDDINAMPFRIVDGYLHIERDACDASGAEIARRRRAYQRIVEQPRGLNALWRGQGQWPRARRAKSTLCAK